MCFERERGEEKKVKEESKGRGMGYIGGEYVEKWEREGRNLLGLVLRVVSW